MDFTRILHRFFGFLPISWCTVFELHIFFENQKPRNLRPCCILNQIHLQHQKCGEIIFSRRRYLVFCFLENYAKLFQGGDSFSTLHSVLKNHNRRNDQTFLLLPTWSHFFYDNKNWNGKRYPFANVNLILIFQIQPLGMGSITVVKNPLRTPLRQLGL